MDINSIGLEEQVRIRVGELAGDRRRFEHPQPWGLWIPVARGAGAVRRLAEMVERWAGGTTGPDAYAGGMNRGREWRNS